MMEGLRREISSQLENAMAFGTAPRAAGFSMLGVQSMSRRPRPLCRRMKSMQLVRRFFCDEEGQDIAEYAVMLAVILVIVVGTVRLIGSNANNVFSSVASSIQ
jgi:Flp pilus assembly pilin Flp